MATTGLRSDLCYMNSQIQQSVGPMEYKLNINQIKSCERARPAGGEAPRGATYGVSTTGRGAWLNVVRDVDVESLLTQRSVDTKRCASGELVMMDVKHAPLVHEMPTNKFLNANFTHLTYPIQDYKELSINRFESLPKDPQDSIFWDFSLDTRILQKDCFIQKYPTPLQHNNLVVPPRYAARPSTRLTFIKTN